MIFSFPIGAYLFFNSQLGNNIDYRYPLSELEFVKDNNLELIAFVGIGDLFATIWTFFLILFTIATFGPKKSFFKVLSPIISGSSENQEGNYLLHTIKWFSIIIVLSELIYMVQQVVGIKTTPPLFENDLLQLLALAFAPIIEEAGFRIILVGIPLFLLYSRKVSARHFFKSLWHPAANLPIHDSKKAIAVIVMVGVFFGVAHIVSSQWNEGKLAQAIMSGIIIGWVYYRYGFVAAILIHWATNYAIFSYAYLVSVVNEIKVMDAYLHSLLQTLEVLLVVTGVLAIALMVVGRRKKETKDLMQS